MNTQYSSNNREKKVTTTMFAFLIWLTTGIVSNGKAVDVDFEKDIWPIFETRCNDCHGPDAQEGQLRLDAKSAFLAGGVSGKLLDSKDSSKSLLLARINGHGDLDRMPLDDDPLSKAQIKLIRQWIKEGAKWPDHIGAKISSKKKHWAYLKPARTNAPKQVDAWANNVIDQFVLARMKEKGLAPAPPAEKGKLLRRLYLDLVGLPPSVSEMNRFSKDLSESAYEDVVDRLLSSPAFGEKWSRSWLDLARYADTNGFQADQFRSVWPYRDWVINAINADMPFDQFTIEQLAGDLLPNATLSQKIATGFHRLTTCNVEAGVDPEQNRVNQVIDRINTTGTVWFGTSFECMQCHNHKYDPFTQQEYYQMFAFFNNTPLEVKNSGNDIQYEFFGPKMELPLSPDKQEQFESINKELAKLEAKQKLIETKLSKSFDKWLGAQKTKLNAPEKWIPLEVKRFESKGGASHQILKDHSVLLSGTNPDKDIYTVEIESDLPKINGFRLEALTHDSLPSKGPGRHAVPGRPNFVVHELAAHELVSTKSKTKERKLILTLPMADFSQKGFPVKGLIDGDNKTAWAIAPKFGQDRTASFLLKTPIGQKGKTTKVKFTIDQHYGNGRNVGRFRLSALVGSRSNSALPADIQKLVRQSKKLNAAQMTRLKKFYFEQDESYKNLGTQLASVKKKLDSIKPDSTLIMIESKTRENTVFKRGNFLDRGQVVKPGTPAVLHSYQNGKTNNRLDFAKWVVSRDNPLTARVVVNRWWQEIFGRGIVATSEDFGTQGEPPTHPQLLDWLANELVDSNWSRKRLIKKIVMSQTYRQTSNFQKSKSLKDPNNLFLSRGPRFRLPAELIRDNYLSVSTQFAAKIGGPPIFPPQPEGIWRHVGRNEPKYETSQGTDRYRRGLYVFWRRSAPFPGFVNFDAPDRASCVVKRSTTNTPLQALTLLNDQGIYELSQKFAKQVVEQKTPNRVKLCNAFQSCTARIPNESELKFLIGYLNARTKFYRDNPIKANELAPNSKHTAETAAWINTIQILFNLDETITKD